MDCHYDSSREVAHVWLELASEEVIEGLEGSDDEDDEDDEDDD